jgi:hypothetical protein
MNALRIIEEAGLVTKTWHYRYYAGMRYPALRLGREKPQPKGGETLVQIETRKGEVLGVGWADCSKADNYSRRLGRLIAAGRALAHARERGATV